MRDAQKPDHTSLSTLISWLKEGRYVVPDFQREFEWKPWDIRDLMRSIFLDYYIGSLLLWKGTNENYEALSCESIYGFEGGSDRKYIVLDGQQRLTALYYAFVAPDKPLPNRANRAIYYIQVDQFMDEEYDEAFNYDWVSKAWKAFLANPEEQYEEHTFPLSVIGEDDWALPTWAQGYYNHWKAKADAFVVPESGDKVSIEESKQEKARLEQIVINAKAFGEHLKGITQEYQISYIELDAKLAIDKVCDIFTQINSRGVRLDVFDLINALLKPKGLQLKHMWRNAKPQLAFVESERMNVYILQVMSILLQAYCSPKYLYYLLPNQEKLIRHPDGSFEKVKLIKTVYEFEERWAESVDALEVAIKLLRNPQEYGVTSSQYLPYVSILPAFGALNKYRAQLPHQERLSALRKIQHWYWASVFTNRYSGSVESTSARDFIAMREWIKDDDAEPSLINEFSNSFRTLDMRKEVKKGSSIYNGIFNLLVIKGAKDWVEGVVPQHDDLDDHHIIPASWGTDNLDGNLVNTVLNRTPLTADTNRHVISDRLPNEYLPEMIERNGVAKVRELLQTHMISPAAQGILMRDPFTSEDFEAFISERQKTILGEIEDLLIKERLDLSPPLRELDAQLESIELKLRDVLMEKLGDNVDALPDNIQQKINERISRAVKKNPSLDLADFEALEKKLEYFDLRELQDTILNKGLWVQFQPVFSEKAPLMQKFDQLAELRNGIRHSRSVTDVTRMEGEAAILWFKEVLGVSLDG